VITHLHSVPVVISDYDRALRFYRDALGFEVTADVTDPRSAENRWLTLRPKAGQTSVMLLKASLARPDFSARLAAATLFVLHSDDLDSDCDRIKANGGKVLGMPRRAGWGAALEVHVADPDQNVFLLVQIGERGQR